MSAPSGSAQYRVPNLPLDERLALALMEDCDTLLDETDIANVVAAVLPVARRYGARPDRITDESELAVARAESRQFREAMSHHRQIAEHYRAALEGVLAVRNHVPAPGTVEFDRAMVAARVALDHPPDWDGTLHA